MLDDGLKNPMNKASLKSGHLRRIKSLALLADEQLGAFLDYVELVSCPRNVTLFQEGEPGDCMYFILQGQMRVFIRQKSGELMSLRLLDAGDAFGEGALLTQCSRSASVEGVMDSELLKLSAANLQKLMAEQPSVAATFLHHQARMMSRQLTDLTNQLRAHRELADLVAFIQ